MIALILSHWRMAATAGLAMAIVVLGLALQHEREARAGAERARDQAAASAAAFAAQAASNRSAAAAAIRAETRRVAVTLKSQEAVHEVLSTPGADARLPDAVRDGWLAGLRGLREQAAPEPAADDRGG